jgi:glutathione S-transferase
VASKVDRIVMSKATLTLTSKNYGAWSLRGWLLCKMSGIEFEEHVLESDDPSTRAELLLLAPSFRVPCLRVDGFEVWDTLAIGEYLHEQRPEAGILPKDPAARAHCRSVCGEMHSGFANLRSALPMNVRARHENFKVWSGVQADIDRIAIVWDECLSAYGGPFLFGDSPTMADAMYAPVCSRFRTYGVDLNGSLQRYRDRILSLPFMEEWIAEAHDEPDAIEELENDF